MTMKCYFKNIGLLAFFFAGITANAFHSEFANARNESPFSPDFVRAYESAMTAVDKEKSMVQIFSMLERYMEPLELAELELAIGIIYNQRADFRDPQKAVFHLSNALAYNLPLKAYIRATGWRATSLDQLNRYRDSIKDWLRILLACSYHVLPREWPSIQEFRVPIYMSSRDPENMQRLWDSRRFRNGIKLHQFLLRFRYTAIGLIADLQSRASITDEQVHALFEDLTPDNNRIDAIMVQLQSENPRPWP